MLRARVLLATIAVACGFAIFDYLRALNVTAPAVLAVPVPPPGRVAARAKRVVWILIDGLRNDTARGLPALTRLRTQGFDGEGHAAFPTYSIPNYVVQACGIDPIDSGVRTNAFPPPVALDSIFRRAKLAGLKVGAFGTDTPWFTKYFGGFVDEARIVVEPPGPPAGELAVVHLDYVDHAGHAEGANSDAYARAAHHADEVVDKIAKQLDPRRDTLVVTSDHGHIGRGGHGGDEPEVVDIPIVLWGAGVEGGHRSGLEARDIAPTIAQLLGLGPLGHARGRSLFGDSPAAAAQRALVDKAVSDEAAEHDRRLSHARVLMLPIAIALSAALFILALTARAGGRGWLCSPIYGVALVGLYRLTDTLSFSSASEQEPFMARFTALASVAAVLQLVVGGRRSAWPACFLASLPAAYALWLAPERPMIDLPQQPALLFFPVVALGALTVICGWSIFWAKKGIPRPE